jgi:glycosyltransferase involved in cell wall biosynthesis
VSQRLVFLLSGARQTCGVEAFARLLASASPGRDRLVEIHPLRAGLARPFGLGWQLGPGAALILNLPLVAWKRSLLAPLLALAAAWVRRAKRVLVLHEWGDLDWKRRLLYRAYLPFASDLLFSSPYVRRSFESDRLARFAVRRIRGVIPIPPNLRRPARLLAHPLVAEIRAWRHAGRFVLASFGSIYPQKQTLRLLAIAAELKRRGEQPVLLMIGDFVRGGDAIEAIFWDGVHKAGLESDVRVSGYIAEQAELFAVFAEVDVFLYAFAEGLTSRRGSVLACLGAGRPVVVNAPTDPAEFDHHETYRGLLAEGRLTLVPPEADVGAFADAVIAARARATSPLHLDHEACWRDAAEALGAAIVEEDP